MESETASLIWSPTALVCLFISAAIPCAIGCSGSGLLLLTFCLLDCLHLPQRIKEKEKSNQMTSFCGYKVIVEVSFVELSEILGREKIYIGKVARMDNWYVILIYRFLAF